MLALLLGAFTAGLLGSLHCIGMCGGFVIACGGKVTDTFIWHIGRLTTYAFLGAVAGVFGSAIPGPNWIVGVVSTLLIVYFAAALAGLVPEPEVMIPGLKKFTTSMAKNTNFAARYGFGVATGFLPCGLVYATLAIPVAMANPAWGALAMVAFGVGTVPALSAVALGLRKVAMKNIWIRRGLAAGVLLAGLWSIGMRVGVLGDGPMHHGESSMPHPAEMDSTTGQH